MIPPGSQLLDTLVTSRMTDETMFQCLQPKIHSGNRGFLECRFDRIGDGMPGAASIGLMVGGHWASAAAGLPTHPFCNLFRRELTGVWILKQS